MGINRRQFIKGAAAAAGSILIPWGLVVKKLEKEAGAWEKDSFYRHAVSISTLEGGRLKGSGVSGSSALVGNEEFLIFHHKTKQDMDRDIKKGKKLLIDWAKERCIKYKVKPKKIEFFSQGDDFGHSYGVGIRIET